MGMHVIMNKIQPLQLAEEQRNTTPELLIGLPPSLSTAKREHRRELILKRRAVCSSRTCDLHVIKYRCPSSRGHDLSTTSGDGAEKNKEQGKEHGAKAGCNVLVNYARSSNEAEEVSREIEALRKLTWSL